MKEVYIEGFYFPENQNITSHIAIDVDTYKEIMGEEPIKFGELYEDWYNTYGDDNCQNRFVDENKYFTDLINTYHCDFVYNNDILFEEREAIEKMFSTLDMNGRIANVSFTLHVLDDND